MKHYKTVLFDMDGVIVDSMFYHAEAWIKVLGEYGVQLSRKEIFMREGMSGMNSIKDIFLDKKMPLPPVEDLKLLQEKKLNLFEKNDIEIFPEIPLILELLKKNKMKLGLVTGSFRRSVDFLLPETVRILFDVIVSVDDIARGKPDPESYLRACELTGCNGKYTLAVENAPLGIVSAKAAGLDCFALETTLSEPELSKADRIFENHSVLLSFIKKSLSEYS